MHRCKVLARSLPNLWPSTNPTVCQLTHTHTHTAPEDRPAGWGCVLYGTPTGKLHTILGSPWGRHTDINLPETHTQRQIRTNFNTHIKGKHTIPLTHVKCSVLACARTHARTHTHTHTHTHTLRVSSRQWTVELCHKGRLLSSHWATGAADGHLPFH